MEAINNIFFTLLALLTVIPAILVVLTVDIVRAACWLLLSLAGAAGLFFFLGADFVGATQLLIYVGGTLVLVIFGVMLTATGPFIKLASRGGDWVLAVCAGLPLFGLLAFALTQYDWSGVAVSKLPNEDVPGAHITTNQLGLAFLGVPQKTEAIDPASVSADEHGHGHGAHADEHGHDHGANHEHPEPAAQAEGDHGHSHDHGPARREVVSAGYLLPFEIVSVHLVVVLIGAAYLARAKRRRTEEGA